MWAKDNLHRKNSVLEQELKHWEQDRLKHLQDPAQYWSASGKEIKEASGLPEVFEKERKSQHQPFQTLKLLFTDDIFNFFRSWAF